ncbi:hypothetical protein ES703_71407 [subsurface metagenome]
MNTAVVELNALADAYRPAADNNRLVRLGGQSLVFLLVAAVEIGGGGVELGGAGIHHLVNRADIPVAAQLPYLFGEPVGQGSDLLVGKAQPFCLQHKLRCQRLGQQCFFHIHDVLELGGKPEVDFGMLRQRLGGYSPPQGGH